MTNLVFRFILSVCLFSVSLFSLASDMYFGGKIGWSHFSNACEPHATECEADSLGGGLLGGYQFNDWLAIEGGYNYYGHVNADYPALENGSKNAPYRAKVQGVELGLKADYALSTDSAIYGKIGGVGWYAETEGEEISFDVSHDAQGISPSLGLGYQHNLTGNSRLRVEYQWVNNVGEGATGGADIHFVTLGVDFGDFKQEPVVEEAPVIIPEPVVEPAPKPVVVLGGDINRIAFEFDSSTLTEVGKSMLSDSLEFLRAYPLSTAKVVGHTDSMGSEDYNDRLSSSRAQSVVSYFVSQGIDASRLGSEGKGEREPVASNAHAEGRAQNRRVEIYIPEFEYEEKQ